MEGGVGWSEGVNREDVEIEEKDLEQEEGVSHILGLMELGLSFSVSSSSSHYPLTSPSFHCLPAQVLSSPQPPISVSPESECRPLNVAAELIQDPRVGEAWGITLHPSQLSGPQSVQGSGMPEPRSPQLGSCLASGCLPGNNVLSVFLIFRNDFTFHPTQILLHTFSKGAFISISCLKMLLLLEACSLL